MPQDIKEEIITLEREFWSTMLAGEHEKSARMIADPSVVISDHGAIETTPEKYIEMASKQEWTFDRWDLGDMTVIPGGDDTAVVFYEADIEAHSKTPGQEMKARTMNSTTWVRKDGKWQSLIHTETPLSKGDVS